MCATFYVNCFPVYVDLVYVVRFCPFCTLVQRRILPLYVYMLCQLDSQIFKVDGKVFNLIVVLVVAAVNHHLTHKTDRILWWN